MDIVKLYNMQKELDERIIKQHGLEGQDLLPNTVLALQVELAEMINEWRGFKHWSNDQEPRRAKVLTEASDCLHFLLSIARQIGLEKDDLIIHDEFIEGNTSTVLSELFIHIGMIAMYDVRAYKVAAFKASWGEFWNILEQRLQIYPDDLYQAYLDKNAENHKRQDTGY